MRIEPRPNDPSTRPEAATIRPSADAQAIKRLLDAQRQAADELAREAQGKGRIIDIRV